MKDEQDRISYFILHTFFLSGQFGDEGIEEVRGNGAGSGKLGFQLVHQGHQLSHLGYDPALHGEGWDG